LEKTMSPLKLKLHHTQVNKIREILTYEEPRVIRRANILNCLHLGYTSGVIAEILNVSAKTVRNIANAFTETGLDSALFDDERSGRPIDIDDRERSRIIAMVCSEPPKGNYRWTLDLIVEEAIRTEIIDNGTISREQVRIILQEHDLKPWLEKMWCIEELSPEYIERMEDVLEVYERPFDDKVPVVCVDEKPVPLIGDVRERIPACEGAPAKIDYEYSRNGSVNVFCAVEPKQGVYFNKVTEHRDGQEFASFLCDLAAHYSTAKKIILVMDNLSTHKEKFCIDLLGKADGEKLWSRFEVHHTPKHASWLNQAEIAIGMYARQCLGDGRVENMANLKGITKAWNNRINKKATIIQWRFTRSKARKSLGYDTDGKKLI
jgi:transposase